MNGYLEMCYHVDGGENLYLRIPTVWDDVNKEWMGFIKTPITNKLISGHGKTSFELQNSINKSFADIALESEEVQKEVLDMFMPAFYWEK